jgi:hypothetical protein
MSLRLASPRTLWLDTDVWRTKMLSPDDLYRQIGDTLYAELSTEHATDLVAIPASAALPPSIWS